MKNVTTASVRAKEDRNSSRRSISAISSSLSTPKPWSSSAWEDHVARKTGQNLHFAKRLIDILDLLKDRTNGRLEPEEEKFLEACLSQLKSHYLEKAQILKF